ncbi:UDP-N-acetylglucosamine 2-epimerase [Peptococcaceae bacterium SCADC1_2_3]|jgi:UDP-N-acetylglucosamine 2-epimerase (non-hydrolysing)|nr:UDP-N-acetylglucosamine 2-epimerase [Peptococcaceae bacterium SCADC1_2_3]KFI37072.1 UDP-N-acetylglucosamine 2-epimerase [Peptococcaceae bacterium SCADC1_2_3]
MLKILVVFGTRPEAIKMAPVVKELKKYPDLLDCKVAVSAQHREMLDQVLTLFKISPDYDLNIMQAKQDLFDVTSRVLTGFKKVFLTAKPNLVLVHGDTTTTFAASLAAFYLQIPVGHVEAGLRTRKKYAPFPEEINRTLTGVLADIHFAPTPTARDNLLREGVKKEDVFVTGNTVIDALLATIKPDYGFADELFNRLVYSPDKKRILLVTAHRRENWGKPLREIFFALKEISENYPEVEIVFPVHKNPAIRLEATKILNASPRIHLTEPLSYESFVNLMAKSYLVLTDSGGLQEEAPSLGKPVLVMRSTTERPEAVAAGTARLVGTEQKNIVAETKALMEDGQKYQAMAEAINPYGDGQAAERIVRFILSRFNIVRQLPLEFSPKNILKKYFLRKD